MKDYNRIILFIVLIILLAGIFIPEKYFVQPARSLTQQISSPIAQELSKFIIISKKNLQNLFKLRNILFENQKLEEENANLINQNTKIKQLEFENKILREQLNFVKTHTNLKLLTAEVISRDPESFLQILNISAGEKDGVRQGQGVILNNFLIGKIEKVYAHHSRVLLITNKESIVNAQVLSSRANGIVVGELGFGLIIESVPQDAKINLGDEVVTSGLGGIIPAGLSIGKISEIISDESEIFKRAAVISPIDFTNLEIVFVVREF